MTGGGIVSTGDGKMDIDPHPGIRLAPANHHAEASGPPQLVPVQSRPGAAAAGSACCLRPATVLCCA